jgi:centractin
MADLHNTPIVIDNGSGTIRAGYAGEDLPKCFFPSFVGRPKHPRVLAGGLEGDVFIGNRAQELRGLLKIRYPLEHGIVTDWDDMERIWQYVYTDELKTLSEEVRLCEMLVEWDVASRIKKKGKHGFRGLFFG